MKEAPPLPAKPNFAYLFESGYVLISYVPISKSETDKLKVGDVYIHSFGKITACFVRKEVVPKKVIRNPFPFSLNSFKLCRHSRPCTP